MWAKTTVKVQAPKNRRLLDIATIDFDDSYTIGISSVDSQHKLIMITYNALVNDAMKLRRSRSRGKVLGERLAPLIVLFSEHFLEEEDIMFREKYPGLSRHVRQHDKFMRDLLTLSEETGNERADFEQIIFYIGAWLSGHILISDRYFGDFCEKRKQVASDVGVAL